MRRALTAAAATTALLVAITACGDDDTSEDTGDGAPDDTAGDTTDPGAVSGELTFWDTSDATNEAPAFKQLVADFEAEYPNVTVNYQSVPFDEAQNKFKTAAEAGTGAPDILRAEVAWVPEFASLGYLAQLDGTALLDDADDYLETPMSSTQYDGATYGVPQVTDALALLYNKQLFEQAGITEPPTTWAELQDAALTIEDQTDAEGFYLNPQGYYMLPFMYGEGGDLVDAESKTIVVDSQENATGLASATDLIESGAAAKPPASDAYDNMMTAFKEGNVAMVVNGPWEVQNIESAPDFGGLDNLGIAPVPGGSVQAGSPVGGHDYVVYEGIPDEEADAAIAFISFMNSTESQAFLAEELGLLPTRASAYEVESVASNPIIASFQPAIESAIARPWIPEGGQFFTALDDMAIEVLVRGQDPADALAEVADTYKSEVVPDYSLN
jgi:arabinogalactan oligomer/maltooligosaccharide transport system substrate-binding protein